MKKNFLQSSIKDSLFTGLIALALFGPIVGLRTVAKNEILVVNPKWLVVAIIVIVCALGRFLTNLYVYKRDLKHGIQSSIGKSITNFRILSYVFIDGIAFDCVINSHESHANTVLTLIVIAIHESIIRIIIPIIK